MTERCYFPLTHLFTEVPHYDGRYWIMPIARCLLQAVHYIHLNHYVHQDIHLNNVFAAFTRDEVHTDQAGALQFKLGDLGVAKLFTEIDATNTRNQLLLPPEFHDPKEFGPMDKRIDIYHCGLLFLELLNGSEMTFANDEIVAGKPRELARQLPAPYNFALEKALRRHVAYRTENAMELWRDLNSPAALPAVSGGERLTLPPVSQSVGSQSGEARDPK